MKHQTLGNNRLVEVWVGCSDGNAVASECTKEIAKEMDLEEIVEVDEEDDE